MRGGGVRGYAWGRITNVNTPAFVVYNCKGAQADAVVLLLLVVVVVLVVVVGRPYGLCSAGGCRWWWWWWWWWSTGLTAFALRAVAVVF